MTTRRKKNWFGLRSIPSRVRATAEVERSRRGKPRRAWARDQLAESRRGAVGRRWKLERGREWRMRGRKGRKGGETSRSRIISSSESSSRSLHRRRQPSPAPAPAPAPGRLETHPRNDLSPIPTRPSSRADSDESSSTSTSQVLRLSLNLPPTRPPPTLPPPPLSTLDYRLHLIRWDLSSSNPPRRAPVKRGRSSLSTETQVGDQQQSNPLQRRSRTTGNSRSSSSSSQRSNPRLRTKRRTRTRGRGTRRSELKRS